MDSHRYYLIPAGTSFRAITDDNNKTLKEIVKTSDSYVVDSGYLIELQKEANQKLKNK